MHPRILELLQQELRDGFPGLTGGEVAATIPISDRIINELIVSLIPEGGKVRDVTIASEPGNLLSAKARLSGPSLLPSIPVTFVIDQQPEFPLRPVLGLKLSQPSKFVAMAFSTLPSMVTLPPALTITGDRRPHQHTSARCRQGTRFMARVCGGPERHDSCQRRCSERATESSDA